jgi:hypothetical protein
MSHSKITKYTLTSGEPQLSLLLQSPLSSDVFPAEATKHLVCPPQRRALASREKLGGY